MKYRILEPGEIIDATDCVRVQVWGKTKYVHISSIFPARVGTKVEAPLLVFRRVKKG